MDLNLFLTIELTKNQLRIDEGLVLVVYPDTLGNSSIGYGFNKDANQYPQEILPYIDNENHITLEVAEYLLHTETENAYKSAMRIFPDFDHYPRRKQAALVNMIYNMGVGSFLTFKNTIQHIKNCEWQRASTNILLSKYAKQVGKRAERIADVLRS